MALTPNQIFENRARSEDPVVDRQFLLQARNDAVYESRVNRYFRAITPERCLRSYRISAGLLLGLPRPGEDSTEFEQARSYYSRKRAPSEPDDIKLWQMIEIVAYREIQILSHRIEENYQILEEARTELHGFYYQTMMDLPRDQAYQAGVGQYYDQEHARHERYRQVVRREKQWYEMKKVIKQGLEYTGIALAVITIGPIFFIAAVIASVIYDNFIK